MIKIPQEALKRLQGTAAAMEDEFSGWRPHYQELAKYILPRRYVWLAEQSPLKQAANYERSRASKKRNEYIIDATGTKALHDLAAGMLNGITSPARPWLRLRAAGFSYDEQDKALKLWVDEVVRRLLMVFAESNFYSAMAVHFVDLSGFGSASIIAYEDFDEVVRFYNSPVGEFRFMQDNRRMVDGHGRCFSMTVRQAIQQFGEENLPEKYKPHIQQGGARLAEPITVYHLIEPNTPDLAESLPSKFKWREFYWDVSVTDGHLLAHNGFYEKPGAWTRWEPIGNDTYGTSPAMNALPDIIQLQQETLRKAQALDYMVRPPIIKEGFLAQNPSALLPGGSSVAPSGATFGAKALYTVNPPLGEITADINDIRARIMQMMHNDLFRMISNLDTVRSATEIDARREEKLVLLGSVLERFENETLDPLIQRTLNIMRRKDLLPPAPENYEDADLEVEYVSILTDAQRAVGTATIERFMQVYGQMLGIDPALKATVDMDEVLRDYGERLSIPATHFNSKEEAAQILEADQELQQTREAALVGKDLTDAAKNLSQTDVGGGANAMQRLLGAS